MIIGGKNQQTSDEIKLVKEEIAAVVDAFSEGRLDQRVLESKIEEFVIRMYRIKGTKPNSNVQ